jgi:hypothetical protein
MQGDQARAHALCQEGLALFQQLEDRAGIAYCLQEWARRLAQQGEAVWALRLWGTAEQLSRKSIPCGLFLLPIESTESERALDEQMLAALRTQLGEKAFVVAWAEGQAMTPEQAIAAQGRNLPLPPTQTVALRWSPSRCESREFRAAHLPSSRPAQISHWDRCQGVEPSLWLCVSPAGPWPSLHANEEPYSRCSEVVTVGRRHKSSCPALVCLH